MTGKIKRLQLPPITSSLAYLTVSAETELPVYAASSVSKLLPSVFRSNSPSAGAVQLYQTDFAEP